MSKTAAQLFVFGLAVLLLLAGLWQLLRLGRRAAAVFRRRDVAIGLKRVWGAFLVVGSLLAILGAWLIGLGIQSGWHVGGLGIAWFLSGIWVPAHHDKDLMSGVREGAGAICVVGTLLMLAGIGLAFFGSAEPVLGTGSMGDVVAFAGFAVHLGGLWAISPGPGGIAAG